MGLPCERRWRDLHVCPCVGCSAKAFVTTTLRDMVFLPHYLIRCRPESFVSECRFMGCFYALQTSWNGHRARYEMDRTTQRRFDPDEFKDELRGACSQQLSLLCFPSENDHWGNATVADEALLSEAWALGKFPKDKFMDRAADVQQQKADPEVLCDAGSGNASDDEKEEHPAEDPDRQVNPCAYSCPDGSLVMCLCGLSDRYCRMWNGRRGRRAGSGECASDAAKPRRKQPRGRKPHACCNGTTSSRTRRRKGRNLSNVNTAVYHTVQLQMDIVAARAHVGRVRLG